MTQAEAAPNASDDDEPVNDGLSFEALIGAEHEADLMSFLVGLHAGQQRARLQRWAAMTGLVIAVGIAWWVMRHWSRDE